MKADKFSKGLEFTIGDKSQVYRALLSKGEVKAIEIESDEMDIEFEFHASARAYDEYVSVSKLLCGQVVTIKVPYSSMNFKR